MPAAVASTPPVEEPAGSGLTELARLVRRSRVLDPVARRQWLAVLPYLTRRDRARLESILHAETGPTPG